MEYVEAKRCDFQ